MQKTVELYGAINEYIVYKKFNVEGGATYNQFYSVYQQNNPNKERQLVLLKAYLDKVGYLVEKKVLQNSGLYSSCYVKSCDECLLQNNTKICYTILKIMKNGSLIQFLRLIKTMPMVTAKYFFKSILENLESINKKVQVWHQTLHASDILVSDEMNPVIVGWSKTNQPINQKDLIYDCCQIFYIMVYGNPLPMKAFSIKNKTKQRYLDKKQWQNLKKILLKKDPKSKIIPSEQFLQILEICLLKDTEIKIKNLLEHNFFKDEPNQIEMKEILQQLEKKKSAEKKQKSLEKMGKVINRMKKIQQQQADLSGQDRYQMRDQFTSEYFDNIDILFGLINKGNSQEISQKKEQKQIQTNTKQKKLSDEHIINRMAFLITNFKQNLTDSLGNGIIFEQDIAKFYTYNLVPSADSTLYVLKLNLELIFQFKDQQSQLNEYETAKIQISINMGCKSILVDIKQFNSHSFYASSLQRYLCEEISILMSVQQI